MFIEHNDFENVEVHIQDPPLNNLAALISLER